MDLARLAQSGTAGIRRYVPGKSIEEVQRELGLSGVVKMASNENPFGTSPAVVRALAEMGQGVHYYPDSGCVRIRSRLAERLGVAAEEIATGSGADGVIYSLGMALIDQGDEVVMPRITFPIYETVVRIMRGTPVLSEMAELRIDLKDMRRRIGPRTKMIFLCNPNNPTGDALPREELLAFLGAVPAEVVVALDEVYADFAEPESRPDSIRLFREGMANLFILRSFSKLYGLAGLRFGYGVGHRELVALIDRVRPPFDVSVVAEQGALSALEDEEFARHTLEACRAEKQLFYRELERLGLGFVPSSTNFILIDTGRDAGPIQQGLLRRGVIVRLAAGYGLPRHIRVTVGRPEENRLFFQALGETLGGAGGEAPGEPG
jgi:histidinol-phosphate aminotransferase